MQSVVKNNQISLENYLGNTLANVFKDGDQIAIWRYPKSNCLNILIDRTGELKRVQPSLEELPPGFVVHPFADQDDKKCYFLEANTVFKIDLTIPISDQTDELPPIVRVNPKSENNAVINASFGRDPDQDKKKPLADSSQIDFIGLVEKGLESIDAGILNKIVPARIKRIHLEENFDVISSLRSLIAAYPNAFINFFHLPTVGTWIGASPELLIRTKADEFETMSLAGTQKAVGDNPLKSAAWTQKEIEEQALVSRYIVDCFKKIRLREYQEHGPKTVVAGNLLHLKSEFKVDMKATNFPQLGSVMLELLHPTSAVCGMPRKAALDFLTDHENFDRSLFAGFIGPVNIENETAIYVNLRTARLLDGFAILYAGAGVTADSIPEKEWEETEMKCDIIGKHLNLNSEF